jgi:hypothetical protein
MVNMRRDRASVNHPDRRCTALGVNPGDLKWVGTLPVIATPLLSP